MPDGFLPNKDADLLAWASNFSTLITATPVAFGLTAGQATAFEALFTAFSDAYTTAIEPSTRTKSSIAARNAARADMSANARLLSRIIQGQATVTAAQKIDLGLNVPAPRTPIIAPTTPPTAEIVERLGTNVRYRLHDGTGSRSRPVGVQGARIYTHTGTTPPVLIEDWDFQGQATRAFVDVTFPADTPAGTVVYFTACWYTARGLTSPACPPLSAIIAGGAIMEEQA